MHYWRYIDSGPASGAENMAIDEELLDHAARVGGPPVLRFYTWDPPAVSLGRFQEEATAVNRDACRHRGIDVVRRVTGGRAVLHYRELTYSIISRADNDRFPTDVIGTYKVIAAGLLAGLRNLGIPAEMAARSARHSDRLARARKDPACFSTPSLYELLVHGRKIIGSAQRRIPGAFLQHGSILLEYDGKMEGAVIPGGGLAHAVTSVREVLGRAVPIDEIKHCILKGFAEALHIAL
jgi:lipoate-protein ligase A